jgi:CDGSH-type Zn-finger protein
MAVKITIRDRGPIRIEGDSFELFDSQGNQFGLGGRTAVSLCRCGQSANKPFCDGTHKECAFESVVIARELPTAPPAPPITKP